MKFQVSCLVNVSVLCILTSHSVAGIDDFAAGLRPPGQLFVAKTSGMPGMGRNCSTGRVFEALDDANAPTCATSRRMTLTRCNTERRIFYPLRKSQLESLPVLDCNCNITEPWTPGLNDMTSDEALSRAARRSEQRRLMRAEIDVMMDRLLSIERVRNS
jgi:hypothetical protein